MTDDAQDDGGTETTDIYGPMIWTIAWKECSDCDGTGTGKRWPNTGRCWKCGGVGRYQVARLQRVYSTEEVIDK